MLISTLGMLVLGLIFFSVFLLAIFYTESGRERATKKIEEVKEKFIWNQIIMMSYANYLGLVLKSKKEIIPSNMDDKNVATGFCLNLLLLAYPLLIAKFLLSNNK